MFYLSCQYPADLRYLRRSIPGKDLQTSFDYFNLCGNTDVYICHILNRKEKVMLGKIMCSRAGLYKIKYFYVCFDI